MLNSILIIVEWNGKECDHTVRQIKSLKNVSSLASKIKQKLNQEKLFSSLV